ILKQGFRERTRKKPVQEFHDPRELEGLKRKGVGLVSVRHACVSEEIVVKTRPPHGIVATGWRGCQTDLRQPGKGSATRESVWELAARPLCCAEWLRLSAQRTTRTQEIKALAPCREGVAFPHSRAAKPLKKEYCVLTQTR